jgi:phage-related protein
MVLLHGFIKKTQKTPKRELELALKRKRQLTDG